MLKDGENQGRQTILHNEKDHSEKFEESRIIWYEMPQNKIVIKKNALK